MTILRSLTFETGPRSLSSTVGRFDVYGCVTERHLRWAWLALVKDGPSLEFTAGPLALTLSWGNMTHADPVACVWAWRRSQVADSDGASTTTEGVPGDDGADARPTQLSFEDQHCARREPTRCPYLSVIKGGLAVTLGAS